MSNKYGVYILGKDDFELPPSLTEYKVAIEPEDGAGVRYRLSAKYSYETPIGDILKFLEAGGTVTYTTAEGEHLSLILE